MAPWTSLFTNFSLQPLKKTKKYLHWIHYKYNIYISIKFCLAIHMIIPKITLFNSFSYHFFKTIQFNLKMFYATAIFTQIRHIFNILFY